MPPKFNSNLNQKDGPKNVRKNSPFALNTVDAIDDIFKTLVGEQFNNYSIHNARNGSYVLKQHIDPSVSYRAEDISECVAHRLSMQILQEKFTEIQCAVLQDDKGNKAEYLISANRNRDALEAEIIKLKNKKNWKESSLRTERELYSALEDNRVRCINQTTAARIEDLKEDEPQDSHAETLFMGKHAKTVIDGLYEARKMEIKKIIGTRRPCILCAAAASFAGQAKLLATPSASKNEPENVTEALKPGALYYSVSARAGFSRVCSELTVNIGNTKDIKAELFKLHTNTLSSLPIYFNRGDPGVLDSKNYSTALRTPPLSPRAPSSSTATRGTSPFKKKAQKRTRSQAEK